MALCAYMFKAKVYDKLIPSSDIMRMIGERQFKKVVSHLFTIL